MRTIQHISLAILGLITLVSQAEPKFRAVDVDNRIEIGYGLAIADVDGDGKSDILLADKARIVWYRNPKWEPYLIADKLTEKDHVCIAAADIDGDGKAEVAVGAEWNPGDTVNSGAVFYMVPPADRTQKWTPLRLPHEPTVHRMRWLQGSGGKTELLMVPLHGRGNKNGEGEGVNLLTYRFAGDPSKAGSWSTTTIKTPLHMTHNFQIVQWDADPDLEFILGGKEGLQIYNRVASGWAAGSLIQKSGQPGFSGAGEVRDGRLPGGGRFIATVEPMHGNTVAAYSRTGADDSWSRVVVDETVVDGHAVACGDLLGLGFDQLVVGWRAMNRPTARVGIRLYTPENKDGNKWRTTQIDDNTMACEDLMLADLNGDGKTDIVAAGRATKNVRIYFNESTR